MFSFLIPTHNYDCSRLIDELAAQANALRASGDVPGFDYEILLYDDASTLATAKEANRAAIRRAEGRLLQGAVCQGQNRARNALIAAAKHPYLLLMDSDAAVCRNDFVRRYVEARNEGNVVCGGLRNPERGNFDGCELRYRYEKAAEPQRTVAWRNAHPYDRFSTFNVLIHRSVLERVKFDERCNRYGYEDALFGIELERQGVSIAHIDNPLVHMGIDTNESFLRKSETAIGMLRELGSPMTERASISLAARRLERLHLAWLLRFVFPSVRTALRRQLLSHRPNLFFFKLYKLGLYLCFAR